MTVISAQGNGMTSDTAQAQQTLEDQRTPKDQQAPDGRASNDQHAPSGEALKDQEALIQEVRLGAGQSHLSAAAIDENAAREIQPAVVDA